CGLLVTSPVVGKHKIERAVGLATMHPDTILCVDDVQNIRDLNDAAEAAQICLNLAIDIHVGGRTGVQPGMPALRIAELIDSLPAVAAVGLQAYAGLATHVVGWAERRDASRAAMAEAIETRWLLEKKGFQMPLLSGGSTGTYDIDSEIEGITELQPGSFIFMDIAYPRICGKYN